MSSCMRSPSVAVHEYQIMFLLWVSEESHRDQPYEERAHSIIIIEAMLGKCGQRVHRIHEFIVLVDMYYVPLE